jgi:hypothetical protein
MSKFDRWSLAVSILGFAAVIYTIHDAAKVWRADVYSKASPWVLDLDKTFVEHPEWRRYFYKDGTNQPVLVWTISETNRAQVYAMSEYILDTYDAFLAERSKYGDVTMASDWTAWMGDTFNDSPSLVYYIEMHKSWYLTGETYKQVYMPWKVAHPDKVGLALTNMTVKINDGAIK